MHGNYQNASRNEAPKAVAAPVEETAPVETPTEAVEAPVAEPVVEAPKAPEKKDVFGVVTDCKMLNVRAKADGNADIVAIIPAGTELMIDRKNSTSEFYKVCNAAGIEGFCMKKYIKIKA